MMKRILIFLPLLVLLAACSNKKKAAAIQPEQTEMTEVVAIGRVEPEDKITAIGSQVNGIVKRLFVREGDTVKKGQVMVELAHDYEDAQLLQAQAKLATQKAEIESVNAQLASAKLKTDNLQNRLLRVKNMVSQGAETQQNLDNAQTEYDQSLADIQRYTAALSSEQAKLNERTTDVNVVRAQIEQKTIKAPANGLVLNMDITEGASVVTNQSLFDFAPSSVLTVLCEVDELLADKVKVGQQAFIRNQGMDGKLATGQVVYVAAYLKKKSLFSDDSGNMEDRRVREVRIVIKDAAPLLYDARVEAVIDIR